LPAAPDAPQSPVDPAADASPVADAHPDEDGFDTGEDGDFVDDTLPAGPPVDGPGRSPPSSLVLGGSAGAPGAAAAEPVAGAPAHAVGAPAEKPHVKRHGQRTAATKPARKPAEAGPAAKPEDEVPARAAASPKKPRHKRKAKVAEVQ
jgi:hypothetical protein